MLYPAFIEIDEDGSASGWFPDIDGCIFAGDSIEEAHADAISAINAHFELLSEKGFDIPSPKSQQTHLMNSINDYKNGVWFLVDIDIDKYDGRAERINITLPHRLLSRIDTIVKTNPEYGSRSGFIATATRKELQKNI
ncbi:conserved protein of unknown function [Xenorhabdus poinarii G6]|uniref:HicB-like antitoxin of toxin-antitoxin system domain-containing protein n=1 Tax=Xenorhabdus poinarii G6 TaxID=1354304 RepID=A0A068R4K5_9GAMM|nr:type II toxin-antitoxin system HicB family antitoxin [Xenorhabdus poinarii]CDG21055.1 conserved protein of unknown function [Xenorhabdus poinarii G6]